MSEAQASFLPHLLARMYLFDFTPDIFTVCWWHQGFSVIRWDPSLGIYLGKWNGWEWSWAEYCPRRHFLSPSSVSLCYTGQFLWKKRCSKMSSRREQILSEADGSPDTSREGVQNSGDCCLHVAAWLVSNQGLCCCACVCREGGFFSLTPQSYQMAKGPAARRG